MKKTLDIDLQFVQTSLVEAGYAIEECAFEDQRLRSKPLPYISLNTANGIRSEITIGKFLFANYSSDKVKDLVEASLIVKGYPVTRGKKSNGYIRVPYNAALTPNQVINLFITLLGVIEDTEGLRASNRNVAIFPTKRYTDVFIKTAKTVRFLHNIEHQLLLDKPRDILVADNVDKLITKYVSTNRTATNSWREHAVPCVMIMNRVNAMIKEGVSDEEIASFIEKHMVVVLISNEEQQKLDVELGMQTAMPEGWKWGDDIFARLHAAGIEFVQI